MPWDSKSNISICLLNANWRFVSWKFCFPRSSNLARQTNYIACSAPHSRFSHSSWQRRPLNNLSADIHHYWHSCVISRPLAERELLAAYGQTDVAMASLFQLRAFGRAPCQLPFVMGGQKWPHCWPTQVNTLRDAPPTKTDVFCVLRYFGSRSV